MERTMKCTVMHTADRMVDAAAARLRAFVASTWCTLAVATVPAAPYASSVANPQWIQRSSVLGAGKPGHTEGFHRTTHLARRQPERCT